MTKKLTVDGETKLNGSLTAANVINAKSDLNVDGLLNAKYDLNIAGLIDLQNVQVINTSCSKTGLVSRTSDGKIMSCQSGF